MVGFAFDLILFFYIPFSLLHVYNFYHITVQYNNFAVSHINNKRMFSCRLSTGRVDMYYGHSDGCNSFISHYSDYTAIMWSFPWSSVLLDRPPSDSQNNLYRMCRIVNSGLGGQIHLGCLFITLKCINLALIFIVTVTLNCLEMMV